MANSEYPYQSERSLYILEGLSHDSDYSNIALSNSEPGVTDAYDPDIQLDHCSAAFYWPGADPEFDRYYTAITITQEDNPEVVAQEAARMRKMILGASIGRAALDRVSPATKNAWEAYERMLSPVKPVRLAIADAKRERPPLPLAVCQFSTVVESKVAPIGETIVHLWYPSILRPSAVLAEFKKTVQEMISDEMPDM